MTTIFAGQRFAALVLALVKSLILVLNSRRPSLYKAQRSEVLWMKPMESVTKATRMLITKDVASAPVTVKLTCLKQ
jgi:hypothetical protein